MPDNVLGAGGMSVNKEDKDPLPHGAQILSGKDRQQTCE